MDLDKLTCTKCGELCVEKENRIMGPLEGRYEYLCPRCGRLEGAVF
jgi:predicted RNA-binding Zn-ribbon protein involved in translation (DUF1610 family)